MKRDRSEAKHNQLRSRLIQEAARLMYEEGVSQYLDAKHLAAKRLLGRGHGKRLRFRPRDLPSNGEIADALHALARLHEGDDHQWRLFRMRVVALETMERLNAFSPRLIGSVSTGRIRAGSDIDLHLFADHIESVEGRLAELKWDYETRVVAIRQGSRSAEYNHLYLQREFPVELSIYPSNEIRVRGRSSTDGKPIIRLNIDRVRDLLLAEHATQWLAYLEERSRSGEPVAASIYPKSAENVEG